MLIVNSLNPPNRYGNIAVTRVLFIFEKKCTMSLKKSNTETNSSISKRIGDTFRQRCESLNKNEFFKCYISNPRLLGYGKLKAVASL